MKLPGLGGLRRLKQNAGRRLRAALVPELRELPGLVTVLAATREDLSRLRQRCEDLADAEGKILETMQRDGDALDNLHYELDRRLERIEEERGNDGGVTIDELDSRLDTLEGLELEDVSELPDRVAALVDRLEALEDLRAGLRALLRD